MLILVFLVGFLLLSRISLKISLLERAGFALPIGLGIVTLLMAMMDWANIALTRTSLTILTVALLLAAAALCIDRGKQMLSQLVPGRINLSWFSLLWVMIICAVVYLEYVNFTKCMIYPTYDRDSLAAFDTIGFVCAQEHTFHGMSIFDPVYFPHMHAPGSSISYLPMIQLSYAYVYIFGAATSKAIPAFLYLSFLVGFYGLCLRRLTHTGAAIALLGILMAPEMLSFASLSVTNVMQACVASSGIIYTCIWVKTQERECLWLAILLLAVNNWMRAEGLVFVAAAWLLVAICSVVRKEYKTILLPLLALLPLVVWTFYSSACGLTSESAIITHPYLDVDKANVIVGGIWKLLTEGIYYGWTFHIAFWLLIIEIIYCVAVRYKFRSLPQTSLLVPAMLIICIAGYCLVLYQVDYKWDSIDNVLAYSAKRFNFCFVPIAWYYIVSALPVDRLLRFTEKHICLGRKFSDIRLFNKK